MKFLIISSSGGGAHLTVAKAQKDELLVNHPEHEIEIVDIMGVDRAIASNPGEAWIPNYGIPFTGVQFFSGKTNVNKWDSSQKMGGLEGVRKLESLIDQQYIAEAIQFNEIYYKLKQFIKSNPELEEVIDTQALSTPAICRAVTEENERRAKTGLKLIKVRKIISEFLTDKTVHYLSPISSIEKRHAACLSVEIVNSPLRPDYESEDEFYKRKKVDHVKFVVKPAPLRAEFLNTSYAKTRTVYLKSASDESIGGPLKERAFIEDMLGKEGQLDGTYFKIAKKEHDKFFMITLGSQSSVTILRYIDAFIDQVTVSSIKPEQRVVFFVAAGKNDGTSNTMYSMARRHLEKRIAELQTIGIKWPDSAKIVPLSFQDDKSMASLFQNTDVLITRTGGMSSIEANETQTLNPKRKVYLHSEATPKSPDIFPKHHFDACYNELLQGTVRWEGGNAQYLMKSIDACLTSPDSVIFNIEDTAKAPHLKDSMINMAENGTLAVAQLEKIIQCLNRGSNPNSESLGGLPLLAYARDVATIEECIHYGGKLTKAVRNHLLSRHVLDNSTIKKLVDLEKNIQNQVKIDGAPTKVQKQFIEAVKKGTLEEVKGLIYRYPQVIYTRELKAGKLPLSMEQFAKDAGQAGAQWIILRAKGATQLHLALKNNTGNQYHVFKRMVYINQQELNVQYPKGETPLTLCTDPKLRELMVMLGANPFYPQESPHFKYSKKGRSKLAAQLITH